MESTEIFDQLVRQMSGANQVFAVDREFWLVI